MARQEDTVTIDNNKYLFTQLDPRRAAKVYMFLMSKLGGTLGKAIGAVKGKSLLDGDVDMKELGDALQSMFNSLEEDSTMQHIDSLLSCVLYNGAAMNLDHLNFQGKMLHMTKVVKKSAEVNFSDFLEGSAGLVAKLKAMFSMIQARQMSTGTSGLQSSQGSQP